MGVAVVTMPEGIVNGPDRVFPKNSVFKIAGSRVSQVDKRIESRAIILVWGDLDELARKPPKIALAASFMGLDSANTVTNEHRQCSPGSGHCSPVLGWLTMLGPGRMIREVY